MSNKLQTFQGLISTLNDFWDKQGCVLLQPYDMEVGAGTFHPQTFLKSLGPEPWNAAHVQASRRPSDGRYGEHPNRGQHFYQYQVVLKPAPLNIQEIYLDSLKTIGINPLKHDIRFVEDNWESPTLGAWGIGWEVWLDGMEVTQFTYFQQAGGIECKPVMGEIAYGIERLAMIVQNVSRIHDLVWAKGSSQTVTYGDIYQQNEKEMSAYNFEAANINSLFSHFDDYETEAKHLIDAKLPIPAYEMVLKASHTFNLLDARRAISVSERQRFILRVRTLARLVAELYYTERERIGFPLKESIDNTKLNQKEIPNTTTLPLSDKIIHKNVTEDILIEIGCEELPPKDLNKLSHVFLEGIKQQLLKAEFSFNDCNCFASPRRLAILVTQVPLQQPNKKIQKRGPALIAAYDKAGNPTPAALGFAKSCGIDITQVSKEETTKGSWLMHEQLEEGKTIFDLIPKFLKEVLSNLPIPRPMRWNNYDFAFVRPIHWITALYGNTVIPIQLFGQNSNQFSFGHRFLHPSAIEIKTPKDYEQTLQITGFVIADFEKRKTKIKSEIEKTVTNLELDAKALIDEALLNEVTGIVEWPVILVGSFDAEFLKIPKEALISAMQVHQKCFPVINMKNELLPKFIITSNIQSIDPKAVIAGNESVMHARLSDAAFYYKTDKNVPLHLRRTELKNVVFQKGLGSLWDKTQRTAHLGRIIAQRIKADPILVERAAHLSKSDLLTQMVGEFPELQGIMGKYYALHDTEPTPVAEAIEEHYLPRFANDRLPSSIEGAALSIADRVDTLIGLFILDKKPTGDKDPFGLRRQALGMLRIIIEKNYDIDLKSLLCEAKQYYLKEGDLALSTTDTTNLNTIDTQALDFCFERLRAFYQEQKISPKVFEAVLAKQISNPADFNKRILAVHHFLNLPEATSLAESNKRVQNILIKAIATYPDLVLNKDNICNINLLSASAEKTLAIKLNEKNEFLKPLLEQKNYEAALRSLADLKNDIDAFFNECMVMVEDIATRNNRLQLLNQLRNLFLEIADISLL